MAMRSTSLTKPGGQLALPRTSGWGGARPGAGRKREAVRPQVPHRPRGPHVAREPLHLTWRAVPGLPSLRGMGVVPEIVAAIGAARCVTSFRVLHFSIQDDHLHLIVEAQDAASLRAGAQGLGVRLGRAINRAFGRRGRVLADRHYLRRLRTPREVRFALAYVVHNFKKHQPYAPGLLDPCSSAAWFDGFREQPALDHEGAAPVQGARTWLARIGWRRAGLVSVHERPRGSPRL